MADYYSTHPVARRNFLLLGGIAAMTGVAGCGGNRSQSRVTQSTQPPLPSATPSGSTPTPSGSGTPRESEQVDLDFASGAVGWPVTFHIGASVSRKYGENGELGCRLQPRPSSRALAALVINDAGFLAGKPWAAISLRFRLVTLPQLSDTYMNLFEIGNTATKAPKSQFTVYFKGSAIFCDFNFNETVQLAQIPTVGTWHSINAIVGYGSTTYHAEMRFDEESVVRLASKNDKSVESVKSLWIHYPTVPVDYTMDIAKVRMVTSSTRPHFLRSS